MQSKDSLFTSSLPGSELRHYLPPALITPQKPLDIALAGIGGTGSQLLSGLARTHHSLRAVGHPGFTVYIFDPDSVSESNIGRQLYSISDIGQNKANVLVTRVNLFFGLNWFGYPCFLNLDKANRRMDILITAVDSAASRIEIHHQIKQTRSVYYWIDTGNTKNTGQVIMGTPANIQQPKIYKTSDYLPTVIDLYPNLKSMDNEKEQGPSCSIQQALERQDLFINSFVANTASHLLWTALKNGYLTYHGAFINLRPPSIRALPINEEVWERMGCKQKIKRRKKK